MGSATSFLPFKSQEFILYVLYALTTEYKPFDAVALEIMEKAAYVLEGLIDCSRHNLQDLKIVHEFQIDSVFAKLLRTYFINEDSPLGVHDLITKEDRGKLKSVIKLLVGLMNCANEFLCMQSRYKSYFWNEENSDTAEREQFNKSMLTL